MTVVICAYTAARMLVLRAAVNAVSTQLGPDDELVVVVDHNPELLERAQRLLAGARVLPNRNGRGLSGARNTGIAAARGELVVFLDDDAVPRPDWLIRLTEPFADHRVIGTGGGAEPVWERSRPDWMPSEFLWVVGCSYRGLPQTSATIRNPIGANMAFRRSAIEAAGGFADGIGRIRRTPLGCEETELSIRAVRVTGGRIVLQPAATVDHLVTGDRTRLRYFIHRCWSEGLSKAVVTRLTSRDAALASERGYAVVTLPAGVFAGIRDGFRGDRTGYKRAAAIVLGLAVTVAGYLRGHLTRAQPPPAAEHPPARSAEARHPEGPSTEAPSTETPSTETPSTEAPSTATPSTETPSTGTPSTEAPSTETPRAGASSAGSRPPREFTPMWSGQLELASPSLPTSLAGAGGRPLERARLLVRAGGTPLGFIELDVPGGRTDLSGTVDLASSRFSDPASRELADTAWTQERAVPVSVVVCTRNRTAGVRRTLDSLLDLRHRQLEIIVVDSAPRDDATRRLVHDLSETDDRVRYVLEPNPGLSLARNRGLLEAQGAYVAFTDDDVRVDPLWISGLLRGFTRRPDVACVTGLVASAALERPAEQYFDRRVWWSSSCAPRVFDLERGPIDSPLHPYAAGAFGTGANFAVRTAVLRSLGGFDECLGAGSPTRGGEDLDFFVRLVRAGHALAYEPAALVWHEHRIDDDSLRKQMYAYGLGLSAYLTKHLLTRGSRRTLLRRMPRALLHALSLMHRSRQAVDAASLHDGNLIGVELRGLLVGPAAYLWARCRSHRTRRLSVTG